MRCALRAGVYVDQCMLVLEPAAARWLGARTVGSHAQTSVLGRMVRRVLRNVFLWIRRESCLSWPQRNDVGVGSQGGVPLLSNLIRIPGDGPTTNTAMGL